MVLDDVFTRFDEVADRVGMEKIKTMGDAYMAVAGAPDPRPDHADAAAQMGLDIIECVDGLRWPTGEPLAIRVGVASGPVVAGVIGRTKFAYDLWGDTVNVASRLESHSEPGGSSSRRRRTELLVGRFAFSEPITVEVEGEGPTRRGSSSSASPRRRCGTVSAARSSRPRRYSSASTSAAVGSNPRRSG